MVRGSGSGTPTGAVRPVTDRPADVMGAVDYGGADGPTGPDELPRFGH
jgi:hypothetical protein